MNEQLRLYMLLVACVIDGCLATLAGLGIDILQSDFNVPGPIIYNCVCAYVQIAKLEVAKEVMIDQVCADLTHIAPR